MVSRGLNRKEKYHWREKSRIHHKEGISVRSHWMGMRLCEGQKEQRGGSRASKE